MTTIRLLGGLGNQMFQHAYGLALKEKGYDVAYDRTHLVPGTHREYSLDGFNSEIPIKSSIALNDIPAHAVIYEAGMRYQEQYMNPPYGSLLIGYWQTEQYFKNAISKVLREFTPRFPLRALAEHWLDEIRHSCCDSAFLHVRRQDYVGLQHIHGMPSIQYYLDAVKALPAHTAVYVFSDDIPWCRQAFGDYRFHFVEGTNKFEDLQLMKACKHAILANSSFSWWGAYLGDDQEGRTVITPKQWFNPAAGIDDTDIVPERWRRM